MDESIYQNNTDYLNSTQDQNIILDLNLHKYHLIDNPEMELISTTEYLDDNVYDKFDAKVSSHRHQSHLVQINKNLPKPIRHEAVLSEWAFACYIGSTLHKIINMYLKQIYTANEMCNYICQLAENFDPATLKSEWENEATKQFVIEEYNQERLCNNLTNRWFGFKRVYDAVFSKLELIASEYIVYDKVKKLSGTIDSLFWKDKTKREVILVDWKTASSFIMYPTKIKNKKSPFFNLMKSKLDRYFCQIHIYSKILQDNYNVEVVSGYVVMLIGDGSFAIYSKKIRDTGCDCTDQFVIEYF